MPGGSPVAGLEGRAKITPEALQTIVTIEIADKLGDLLDYFERGSSHGIVNTSPPLHVTSQARAYSFVALNFTIFNDGPGDVYVTNDNHVVDSARESPLKPGDSFVVKLGARLEVTHWYQTLAGEPEADIRVFSDL